MTQFEFVRARLLAPPPPLAFAIPLALPFIIAPTLLRWMIDRLNTGTAFVAYYPFVLLAALLLGWRAAAIVMVGSAIVANFLFMEPRYTLFSGPDDTLGAVVFCLSSSLIIAVADTLKRAVVEVQEGARRETELNGQLQNLNSELQHRVRNTLTVVQGLAVQTFRGTPAEAELRTFRGRLQALAEAHEVLTSGRWEGCQLPDLAVRALAPFNGQGAVRIDGPTCTLPEAACIPLVLALHELGTNAVKYGALSSLHGAVEVVWTVVAAEDRPHVVLRWTESEGPKVEPPTREGLGSRLLKPQRGLDDVALEFSPEGLTCNIIVACAAESSERLRAVR